ncbi:MAG: hypothetical protein FWF44_01590, partial [Defluviitaleaceae bacterium]|nr:hypothetical protein [Defluviitaleaceae bacterium]
EIQVNETYHSGRLYLAGEGISVYAESVVVTAVKPAMDGRGVVLRAYESAGCDTVCDIRLPLSGRSFTASFGANQVKTFRIPENLADEIMEVDLMEAEQ